MFQKCGTALQTNCHPNKVWTMFQNPCEKSLLKNTMFWLGAPIPSLLYFYQYQLPKSLKYK